MIERKCQTNGWVKELYEWRTVSLHSLCARIHTCNKKSIPKWKQTNAHAATTTTTTDHSACAEPRWHLREIVSHLLALFIFRWHRLSNRKMCFQSTYYVTNPTTDSFSCTPKQLSFPSLERENAFRKEFFCTLCHTVSHWSIYTQQHTHTHLYEIRSVRLHLYFTDGTTLPPSARQKKTLEKFQLVRLVANWLSRTKFKLTWSVWQCPTSSNKVCVFFFYSLKNEKRVTWFRRFTIDTQDLCHMFFGTVILSKKAKGSKIKKTWFPIFIFMVFVSFSTSNVEPFLLAYICNSQHYTSVINPSAVMNIPCSWWYFIQIAQKCSMSAWC